MSQHAFDVGTNAKPMHAAIPPQAAQHSPFESPEVIKRSPPPRSVLLDQAYPAHVAGEGGAAALAEWLARAPARVREGSRG